MNDGAGTAKKQILHELFATTGVHRNHAGEALRKALVLKVARPSAPLYGVPVIDALQFAWAVQALRGRSSLPGLIVPCLSVQELHIDVGTAAQRCRSHR